MNQNKNSDYVNKQLQMQMKLNMLNSTQLVEQQNLLAFPNFSHFNPYSTVMSNNYTNSIPMTLMSPSYQYENPMFTNQALYQQVLINILMNINEERAKTSDSTEPNNINQSNYFPSFNNASKEMTVATNLNPQNLLLGNTAEQLFQRNNLGPKSPLKNSTFTTQVNSTKPLRQLYKKIFRTRLLKSRMKKKEIKKIYKCGHEVCGLVCKTKNQIISHHGKMNHECQKDTTYFLKGVFLLKKILHELIANSKIKKSKELMRKYEDILNDVSKKEYAHLICGLTFDDIFERDIK